jgi:3-methyladenine DNA glycosylase AlkD
MVRSEKYFWAADWLNAYVVKVHPENESFRTKWMYSEDPMAARAGWNLTSIRVAKKPDGLDIPEILDYLESHMPDAPPEAQWTMNFTLVEIGINMPEYRERAIALGEKMGIYRDFPTAKGCTSPFAPIWINEMVKRQA